MIRKKIKMNIETQISAKASDNVRIAIQGVAGAFHEIAARKYQTEQAVKIVPASTFEEVIAMAQDTEMADGALMAIENSIYGSIIPNYDLIRKSDLEIIGEVYLRIKQNLLVHEGQSIEQITEVYSHPVALVQCKAFFQQYPHIRLIEAEDTALSVKMVKDNNWKHAGAIASTLAGEMYEMNLLAAGIETNTQNYTRFLVLAPKSTTVKDEVFNKVSLSFTLRHEVGSLHKILAGLEICNANLTKIQSVPIVGKPWEYRFYLDYLVKSASDFQQTMEVIEPLTLDLKLLGTYKKGKHHEN
jgi:prephenate dehydratase